jgi:hypothetical protein
LNLPTPAYAAPRLYMASAEAVAGMRQIEAAMSYAQALQACCTYIGVVCRQCSPVKLQNLLMRHQRLLVQS